MIFYYLEDNVKFQIFILLLNLKKCWSEPVLSGSLQKLEPDKTGLSFEPKNLIPHQAFMVKGKICYKHSLRDYHLIHQAFTGTDTFKTRPSKWRNRVPFNFKAWHHECKHSNVCQMSSPMINSNQYFNLINFSNNTKKMKYASGNKALISNKSLAGTCFGGEDPLLQFFMKVKNCQHWF